VNSDHSVDVIEINVISGVDGGGVGGFGVQDNDDQDVNVALVLLVVYAGGGSAGSDIVGHKSVGIDIHDSDSYLFLSCWNSNRSHT
jgi:hypothetical protein